MSNSCRATKNHCILTKNMAINDITSDLSVILGYWGKYNCNNTGIVSPMTIGELD